jgi:hypothetical protein
VAIKKCPYCKAFIEEDSEFCSNCGTKLIFPEDEDIEEEIPGERIIEMKEEDAHKSRGRKQQPELPEDIGGTSPEENLPESEETGIRVKEEWPEDPGTAPPPEDERKSLDDSTADEMEEPDSDAEGADAPEEETGDYIDLKEEEEKARDEEEELFGPAPDTPPPKGISPFDGIPELEEEEKSGDDPAPEPKDKAESETGPFTPQPDDDEESLKIEKTPRTGSWLFPEESAAAQEKKEETEEDADSSDKEKEEIERLLDTLKKERQEIKKRIKDIEGDLPPWAEKMKDSGKQQNEPEVKTSEVIATKASSEPKQDTVRNDFIMEKDSGMHEEASTEKEGLEAEEDAGFSGTNQGMLFGSEQEESRSRAFGVFSFLKLSRKFKSRLFDILLVAGLWLISFGIAAHLTGTQVFRLITEAVLPAAGFFVILILVYFGLFLIFLRETLGDLIFSKKG